MNSKVVSIVLKILIVIVIVTGLVAIATVALRTNMAARESEGIQHVGHLNCRIMKITVDGQDYIIAGHRTGDAIAICPAKEKKE